MMITINGELTTKPTKFTNTGGGSDNTSDSNEMITFHVQQNGASMLVGVGDK